MNTKKIFYIFLSFFFTQMIAAFQEEEKWEKIQNGPKRQKMAQSSLTEKNSNNNNPYAPLCDDSKKSSSKKKKQRKKTKKVTLKDKPKIVQNESQEQTEDLDKKLQAIRISILGEEALVKGESAFRIPIKKKSNV